MTAPRPGRPPPGPAGPAGNPVERPDTLAAAPSDAPYELRLYVAGQTAACVRGGQPEPPVRGAPDRPVPHRTDRSPRRPSLARSDEIIAIATLVRRLPPPVRKILGDLSNTERVLTELQLRPPDRAPS